MSNVYQPKRKELALVKVVSSDTYNEKRSSLRYVGSINRGFSSFITNKRNRKTGQCTFIDDTSSLTKKTKNDITKFFSNKNNRSKGVAYLVVDKQKSTKKGK